MIHYTYYTNTRSIVYTPFGYSSGGPLQEDVFTGKSIEHGGCWKPTPALTLGYGHMRTLGLYSTHIYLNQIRSLESYSFLLVYICFTYIIYIYIIYNWAND